MIDTRISHFIGIDIGGTKTVISVVDREHTECNADNSMFMETSRQPDFSVTAGRIFDAVDKLLEKRGVLPGDFAIGISCPGPLDLVNGKIAFVATTGWKDIPIVRIFAEKYKVPVFLDNDCSCAALAEARTGSGKDAKVIFYVTVSTGVGSGICVNGDIFGGESGNAGEFGHICVDPHGLSCPCGGRGCLEMYSSGTAIARRYMELTGGGKLISAHDVEAAVRRNEPAAVQVWNDAMEKLGVGVSIVYQLFNPGVIAFGGGVSNAWDLMEARLYETVKKHVYEIDYPIIFGKHVLRQAMLGKYIGVTGAILLARKKTEWRNI